MVKMLMQLVVGLVLTTNSYLWCAHSYTYHNSRHVTVTKSYWDFPVNENVYTTNTRVSRRNRMLIVTANSNSNSDSNSNSISADSSEEDKVNMAELVRQVQEKDSNWLREVLGDVLAIEDLLTADSYTNSDGNSDDSRRNSADSNTASDNSIGTISNSNNRSSSRSQDRAVTDIKSDRTKATATSNTSEGIPSSRVDSTAKETASGTVNRARDRVYSIAEASLHSPEAIKKLLILGYYDDEIPLLKPKVVELIVNGKLHRPEEELPVQWYDNEKLQQYYQREADEEDTNARRDRATSYDRKDSSNYANAKTSPRSTTKRDFSDVRSMEPQEQAVDTLGEAKRSKFYWQGTPITYDETKKATADVVDDADEGEPRFWPSSDEFKDMLLDESRMRIELLGDWISPLVRQETKWRYNVYKDWLNILEEGSGNAFDVVEESLEAGEDNDLDYEFRGPSRREMRQTKPSKPAKSFVPPSVARDPPARVRVPIDEARSTSDSFSKAARRTLRTDSDMFPSRANNPVRKSRNAKAYERYIRRRMLEDNVPWSDIDEEEKKIEEENKRIYEQPTDKDRWFGDDEQEKSLNQQEVRSTYRDIPSRNSKIGRGTRNQWVDGSPSSRRPDVLRPKVRIFPMETAVRSDQPPLDEVEDTNAWTISATRRPIEPKGVYSMNKREVKTEDMSPSFPSTREYEDSDDV